MGLKHSAGGKLKIDLHTEGRIKLFYGWSGEKKTKPPYSGGSHIKLFLEIKLLHRLAGSQCCGADHLLGKVCGYPSMKSHMMGSRWWYPSASWHGGARRLTVLTIFICTSRLGAWQGWALLPRTIREIWGDPRSAGSMRQTQGIEPNPHLVS